MRVQVVADGRARSVALSIDDPDATVADLAQALFLDPSDALVLDGVVHLPDTLVEDVALVDGAFITSLSDREPNRSGIGNTWVGVIAGPHSGTCRRLDAHGTVAIGRDPSNDLVIANSSVSNRHAIIELDDAGARITDLDSLNGTWIAGTAIRKATSLDEETHVQLGSSTSVLRSISHQDRPIGTSAQHRDASGKILINRPPRGPVISSPQPVQLPDEPAERLSPTLTVVSLLVPILFAAVMVVVLGSWRYAIFGLLSPVMAIGNWISGRRRVRREREGDVRTHRDAMSLLRRELSAASATERDRRRTIGPDLLEVRRRIELPSSRLWERRPASDDAMVVRLGLGDSPWTPPTEFAGVTVPGDVAEAVDAASGLTNVEILADLRSGPLGLVGPNAQGVSAARSLLLQLAAHHGPADCRIAVFTTPERLDEWRWAAWLPHTATASEAVQVVVGAAATHFATSILQSVEGSGSGPLEHGWVIVVDDVDLLHQRSSATRRLLEMVDRRIFGIVLTSSVDQLPSSVASVVEVQTLDGAFSLSFPSSPGLGETGMLDAATVGVAEDLARSLARFDDPEKHLAGGSLPRTAGAGDVFGDLDSVETQKRWMLRKRHDALIAPLGIAENGPFEIDLVADGPHGLIAGTTGAGKSELLRTLIVGLASNYGPDDLVFVLIDYKGGSAFDCCSTLPHVVGMVTDLDDHLAERALLSLDAELHVRERVLRAAGAKDIADYRAAGSPEGDLPRLVVVIDEFATLRSELPDFVSALIGIAQRGRSLGVHLVLATQRPSGAVDANIRANTNLRIALRVQDPADSTDVIDTKIAAEIPRTVPGRAYVRRGDGDLIGVQTAYLSGPEGASGPPIRTAEVPVGSGIGPQFAAGAVSTETTDLEVLVDVCVRAARTHQPPRRPWLDELPDALTSSDVAALAQYPPIDDADVILAIGDDPAAQRRVRVGWSTGGGHLGVVGVLGSGVTTTIRSAIARLVDSGDRPVWVFPVDHGAGGLAGIDRFAQVSAVIEANDDARQQRLLQFVGQEMDRRRDAGIRAADVPLIVIAIDGIAAFAEANELVSGTPNGELWSRIGRDGPAVGIVCLLGATRYGDIPRSIRGTISQHVVLEQSGANGYADFGIRMKSLPKFGPGRALWGSGGLVAQVIAWDELIVADERSVDPPLPVIEALPSFVPASVLAEVETLLEPGLSIPIGIDGTTRRVTRLTIRPGEHATVSGPSQSGRTSALRTIARQLRAADPSLILVGLSPTPGASLFDAGVFDAGGTTDDLDHVLSMAVDDERRWVVIVDDADRIDVESGPLLDLAKNAPALVTLIVAVRSSAVRQAYGHWTRFVRASGTGILLLPDNAVDGDILGVRLPRSERLDPVPGRGYLVSNGEAHAIHVAV